MQILGLGARARPFANHSLSSWETAVATGEILLHLPEMIKIILKDCLPPRGKGKRTNYCLETKPWH